MYLYKIYLYLVLNCGYLKSNSYDKCFIFICVYYIVITRLINSFRIHIILYNYKKC